MHENEGGISPIHGSENFSTMNAALETASP